MPKRPPPEDAAPSFLLVESDQPTARDTIAAIEHGFGRALRVREAASGVEAMAALKAGQPGVVLADLESIADLAASAEEAVARIARIAGSALLIALSEVGSVSTAVAAMRGGAHDCVTKPVGGPDLAQRVGELARRHGKSELLGANPAEAAEPVGSSAETALALARRLIALSETGGALEPPAFREAGRPKPILPMWRQEQQIIEEAIARFSGNVALAAAALELSPSTIYRKRQAWAEAAQKKGAA